MPPKYFRSFTAGQPTKMKSRLCFRVYGSDKMKEPVVSSLLGGRYYLTAMVGKGGMSVVYKAWDKNKDRIVAVKTLRYQWADDGVTVKRFQREAQTLNLLRHPSIVSVYDFGESGGGQPFFVMDFLTGVSLADLLKKQGHLPIKRVRGIFRRVFDAIQHAHNAGLIHRDLKPNNIMVVGQDGKGDVVKIVDFGIAKLQQEAQKLTRVGEVWGSPVYMSPEQCMGASLDKRSDVYSLGVCLYESLTGKLPLIGKNYLETMTLQINQAPPPIREIRPDLLFNEELELVVLKSLQKNPDERFQTIPEFKEGLEDAIDRLLPTNKTTWEVTVRRPSTSSLTRESLPQKPLTEKSSTEKITKINDRVDRGKASGPKLRQRKSAGKIPIIEERIYSYSSARAENTAMGFGSNSQRRHQSIVLAIFVILAALSALSYLYVLTQLGPDAEIDKIPPALQQNVIPVKPRP